MKTFWQAGGYADGRFPWTQSRQGTGLPTTMRAGALLTPCATQGVRETAAPGPQTFQQAAASRDVLGGIHRNGWGCATRQFRGARSPENRAMTRRLPISQKRKAGFPRLSPGWQPGIISNPLGKESVDA